MASLLGQVAEVRIGYSFRRKLQETTEGDVAVVQMKDIDDCNLLHTDGLVRIEMPELAQRHMVRPGDLLFRSRGGSNPVALVAADLDRTVLASPMILIRPRARILKPEYLHWFLNHPDTQKALISFAAGSAVKMISKSALEQLAVVVPPLAVQTQIVELARLAAEEERLTNAVRERRKLLFERTLMQRAQTEETQNLRSEEMARKSSPNIRFVQPSPEGGWDNKKAGASRAASHHETKQQAVDVAREMSQREGSELKIKNLDGKIAQSDSHGHDPRNIKG